MPDTRTVLVTTAITAKNTPECLGEALHYLKGAVDHVVTMPGVEIVSVAVEDGGTQTGHKAVHGTMSQPKDFESIILGLMGEDGLDEDEEEVDERDDALI